MMKLQYNKRSLVTFILLIGSSLTWAYNFVVDGIFYNYNSDGTSVTVTYRTTSYNSYSGTVAIPSKVAYNNKTYDVTSIGEYAFYNCSGLTSVTIPNSVKSIGEYSFYGCSGLTKAEFASIESLCNISFGSYTANPLYYSKHLYINGQEVTDLVIPNSVTSIGSYAFYGCSGLTSITTTNSVTSIGNSAFSGCSDLTSFTIPESVTSIGHHAFYGCSKLTSITIPNSVTSIGSSAFYNTAWYNNQPDGLIYAGKVAYKYKGTMPSETHITIEEGTLGITTYAFKDCTGLTSVTIPNSVTSIGNSVFSGCSGLTSVTIPNSVTSIGEYTFSGCSGLTSVTIPESVTSIGQSAFNNCNNLTKAEFVSIESLCKIKFDGVSSNPLYYAHNLYINGQEVKDLVIPNSVTSIGSRAFYNCYGLTSVTIPNSVTSIGEYSFYACSGLTSVHINDIAAWCNIEFATVEFNPLVYAHHLFLNGQEVKDLIIPNTVTSIGEYNQEIMGKTNVEIIPVIA